MSGIHRLSLSDRRARVAAAVGLTPEEADALSPSSGLDEQHATQMVENAIGVLGMPLGVAVNLLLDGRDVIVPMAVEEPSVIAACSYAAKLLSAGGGVAWSDNMLDIFPDDPQVVIATGIANDAPIQVRWLKG